MTPPSSGSEALMNSVNHCFPVRKNPRIPNFDYSSPGYYFITVCTKEKRCIFGDPIHLNRFGRIAEQCFTEIQNHFQTIHIDKFVVMPNHIHGIVVLQGHQESLPTAIGLYKSAVTKKIHAIDPGIQVWQPSFHDHIIRNEQDYLRIWNYIDTNPLRWREDCFFSE